MADVFWLVVVAGGPLLLGAVVVYVLLRQRRLHGRQRDHDRRWHGHIVTLPKQRNPVTAARRAPTVADAKARHRW